MSNRVRTTSPLSFVGQMKRDWNQRARGDARWYINTAETQQSEDRFFETGRMEVERLIRADLDILTPDQDPRTLRLLEIGCGIGRMTRFLANIFGDVCATDVSKEMIAKGRNHLRDLRNVRFQETDGVDFGELADCTFDVALSAFVYQHVPSRSIIRANLADAYRVLRPGGVFKFQTNGVTNCAYQSVHKDTWGGDVFPESEVRALAMELGAQLIRIVGTDTQYCWTILRKPVVPIDCLAQFPRIEWQCLSDGHCSIEFRAGTESRHLTLLVSGLNHEIADANRLSVVIGPHVVAPYFVGPVRHAIAAKSTTALRVTPSALRQVDVVIPRDATPGLNRISIRISNGETSPAIDISIPQFGPVVPQIVLITNGTDGGIDIYSSAGSKVRLFVDGLDSSHAPEEFKVMVEDRAIRPMSVQFVPSNGLHMLELLLPDGMAFGKLPIYFEIGNIRSPAQVITIKKHERLPQGFVDRAGRKLRGMAQRCKGRCS